MHGRSGCCKVMFLAYRVHCCQLQGLPSPSAWVLGKLDPGFLRWFLVEHLLRTPPRCVALLAVQIWQNLPPKHQAMQQFPPAPGEAA